MGLGTVALQVFASAWVALWHVIGGDLGAKVIMNIVFSGQSIIKTDSVVDLVPCDSQGVVPFDLVLVGALFG